MDLVAVKECTDVRFLPPRFQRSDARGARATDRRPAAICLSAFAVCRAVPSGVGDADAYNDAEDRHLEAAMFARIGRLLRGFLGLFISGVEEANPEALMEAARQEFREKMSQYNLALARMARRGRAPEGPGQAPRRRARRSSSAASSPTIAPATWSWPASLARELQELKADLADGLAGAEGDRRGLPGQPASGEARPAGVRGQGAKAREAIVAGPDQRGPGRGGGRAHERRPSRSATSATR